MESSNQKTQLNRIERKIDRNSLIGWFFGGIAIFVLGMSFAKDFEGLSPLWWYAVIVSIVGILIMIVVGIIWIYRRNE